MSGLAEREPLERGEWLTIESARAQGLVMFRDAAPEIGQRVMLRMPAATRFPRGSEGWFALAPFPTPATFDRLRGTGDGMWLLHDVAAQPVKARGIDVWEPRG